MTRYDVVAIRMRESKERLTIGDVGSSSNIWSTDSLLSCILTDLTGMPLPLS